jgi:hypothetical protein
MGDFAVDAIRFASLTLLSAKRGSRCGGWWLSTGGRKAPARRSGRQMGEERRDAEVFATNGVVGAGVLGAVDRSPCR